MKASTLEARSLVYKVPLLICFGLFLLHFFVIWKYAVDIPYWDEWSTFNANNLPKGLTFHWLFVQQNEHRPVTTKLLVWSLFQLNGWNLVFHQLLNFILYGFILTWLVWFVNKLSKIPVWVVSSFIIFLLSPINYENLSWGYQSLVHFWLLFFLASSYYLFAESQRWTNLLIGCALSILSIYSFGSGVASSSTTLVIFCLFKCVRAFSFTASGKRAHELLQMTVVVMVVGGALALWLIGYHKPAYHPALTFPYQWKFWNFFLNNLSFGFGIETVSALLGAICLLLVLVPILGILRQKSNLSNGQWGVFAIVMSVIAVLASISVSRAEFGPAYAKSSRYAEFGMVLIPLSLVSWSFFLKDKRRLKNQFIAGLWLFCFLTFANNWVGSGSYEVASFHTYRSVGVNKMAGVECVRAYYFQGGNGHCPTIYPAVIAAELEEARKLNVSFYRTMYHQYQQGNPQSQKFAPIGTATIGPYRFNQSSSEATMPSRIKDTFTIHCSLGWESQHDNRSILPH